MPLTHIVASSSSADLTTYTYTATSLGTATAQRKIIIGVVGRAAGTTATLTGVTVGGFAATQVINQRTAAINTTIAGLYIINAGTGSSLDGVTSANIVVTFSEAMLRATLDVFHLDGAYTLFDTGFTSTTASGATQTVSIDVPHDSEVISLGAITTVNAGSAWTGLTERSDQHIEGNLIASAASGAFVSSQTGLNVTMTTFNPEVIERIIVAASWGSSAFSIAAGAGSYTLAGTAVSFSKSTLGSFLVAVDAGSYALTGTAASAAHSGIGGDYFGNRYFGSRYFGNRFWGNSAGGVAFTIAASAGSYVLTGTDATLTTILPVSPPLLCMTPDDLGGLGSKTYTLTTTAGNIVIVFAGCEHTTVNPAQSTISDTAGWTWVPQFDETYATGSNPRLRGRIWTATSNGVSNDVTVFHGDGGSNPIGMLAVQVANASGTLRNKVAGKDGAGDPSIIFPDVIPVGHITAAFGVAGNFGALTPGAGMTEIADVPYAASAGRLWYGHDLTAPGSTQSWSSTNLFIMAMAFEIGLPTATFSIAADAGSYTLTGADAFAVRDLKVASLDIGSYALTGADIAFFISGGNKIIAADAGFYELTGTDAEFVATKIFSVTGQMVIVSLGTVIAQLPWGPTNTSNAAWQSGAAPPANIWNPAVTPDAVWHDGSMP